MKLTDTQLQEMARQLRCPDNDGGLKVAEMMAATNSNMITKAIESLQLGNGDAVLEIGPGNACHVKNLLAKANGINYTGIDISPAMINEAQKRNEGIDNVTFKWADGKGIPFSENCFTKIFTANTIYFWDTPQEYANEIARVLQPGGIVAIAFIPKSTMQHIPFAKFGFTLYDVQTVIGLLTVAGLTLANTILGTEFVTAGNGGQIQREFAIVTVTL